RPQSRLASHGATPQAPPGQLLPAEQGAPSLAPPTHELAEPPAQAPPGQALSTEQAAPLLPPPTHVVLGASALHVAPPHVPSGPQHALVMASIFLVSALASASEVFWSGHEGTLAFSSEA